MRGILPVVDKGSDISITYAVIPQSAIMNRFLIPGDLSGNINAICIKYFFLFAKRIAKS